MSKESVVKSVISLLQFTVDSSVSSSHADRIVQACIDILQHLFDQNEDNER